MLKFIHLHLNNFYAIMSTDTTFWSQLEEFAKRRYPESVKESLLKCGYDSIESLRIISDESIPDMEDHLKIKFLPAHKDFIMDIPEQIEKMNAEQKPPKCRKQKKPDSENQLQKRKLLKNIEEGEVKCKPRIRPQGLREQLLDKIRKYVNGSDLTASIENITSHSLIGFKRCGANEKHLYECYFKCPVCEKSCLVKCNQAKVWDTRNFNAHLNKYHKSKADKAESSPVTSTESRAYSTPVIQSVYTMNPTAGSSMM